MKNVVILGSTGSVGLSALEVIRRHGDKFKVVGLAAGRNERVLAGQVRRFKPRLAALGDVDKVSAVASMKEADIVLVAISGTSAIIPLLAAIRAGKKIALANKESIVSAGNIIMALARRRGVEIIPVDSEHNSIFQCLKEEKKKSIKKIFLMGTGGPLKDVPESLFDTLKPSRILAHPVWRMGRKISVDSATMMNKGLEVIEASHLFGVDASRVEVLLHPEAIIHSMVELVDGNIISNMFHPDMKMPIFYALNHPARRTSRLPGLDFSKIKKASFQKPDRKKFPALGLCYDAAKKGGTYPACLTAANEEAVRLYLEGRISFTGIIRAVKKVLKKHKNIKNPSIGQILEVDRWAKELTCSHSS